MAFVCVRRCCGCCPAFPTLFLCSFALVPSFARCALAFEPRAGGRAHRDRARGGREFLGVFSAFDGIYHRTRKNLASATVAEWLRRRPAILLPAPDECWDASRRWVRPREFESHRLRYCLPVLTVWVQATFCEARRQAGKQARRNGRGMAGRHRRHAKQRAWQAPNMQQTCKHSSKSSMPQHAAQHNWLPGHQ